MAVFKETILELEHKFDNKRKRHYLNGHLSVLHCHHYATLYTQLALDANETDLLTRVSEETFYKVLSNYYKKHNLTSVEERVEIACQYYASLGLGKMKVCALGDDRGEVILENSHLDKGWIKKWGEFDAPVNYITSGYIAGLFSAVLDEVMGAFKVFEIESIVMGAEKSRFNVVRK